jgi:nicotinamide-nucleotide amidase
VNRAAIITVGSELVEGLRIDTNTAEIARALASRGLSVAEAVSVGDDEVELSETIGRLVASCRLVVVTGGLGPTHDDITRDAAARALGVGLQEDAALIERLRPTIHRHREADAAEQVLTQALILDGARVIQPTSGTAPGQLIETGGSVLALLPGPPHEMRGMLPAVLELFPTAVTPPVELGVVGLAESDAQLAAQRGLAEHPGVALTVLAKPGDVRVILLDAGAGPDGIEAAVADVAAELGGNCYSIGGTTLSEVVIREATARGTRVATAESCTGGLVSAALTDVAGSSEVFLGGVVSYSDDVKADILGVERSVLRAHGAVSAQVASAMARGALARLGADIAVSVTGIAGPEGGTADKPVGLVWFAIATCDSVTTTERHFAGGNRDSVRARATSTALDLLRRTILQSAR